MAWLLWPASVAYGWATARRMKQPALAISDVPVLCIGNLIAGGAGKTPTAIAIAKIARKKGLRPGFLSRGYGAINEIAEPTLVDVQQHSSLDVGDEPLILAQYADSVVSPDRPAGAALLHKRAVDLIIMDDGFQNPSLHKDYNLIVVDARRGIGNGFCIPAGPLRVDLRTQLAAANSVLVVGQSPAGTEMVRHCARVAKPVHSAEIKLRQSEKFRDMNLLAYCGIADPAKFYASLEQAGANVEATRDFSDHHPFTVEDCRELMAEAAAKRLKLATTEKDHVRLIRTGSVQQELGNASHVLPIELEFENPKLIDRLIDETLKRAEQTRISKPERV
ncbi:MAG: tetraacyldisaccharide 4'-kinase [Rhizobiaceae bacterium]